LAAVGLAGDQITKWLALRHLADGPRPLLGDWLQLWLTRNSGAAFSMGEDWTYGLSALAVVALVAGLVWAVRRVRRPGWAVVVGLGLAGVGGNLADRLFRAPGVMRGHVVDFIFVRHFATFNLADSCLTIAAGLVIWLTWRGVAPGPERQPVVEATEP
jgi:signal peptidase II